MSDKLVNYINKGLKQGFNTDYIRKTLLKHGYSRTEVEFAINKATGSKPKQKSDKTVLIGVITVAALLLMIAISGYANSASRGKVLQKQLMQQEKTIQGYLDQVAVLSEEIDAKEKTIDQQIRELRTLDMKTIDREKLVIEIDYLYQKIKEERRQVRDLLVELLKEIVYRYKGEGQGSAVFEEDISDDPVVPIVEPKIKVDPEPPKIERVSEIKGNLSNIKTSDNTASWT